MPIQILADRPPPSKADPRLRELHAYWNAIRRQRRFPALRREVTGLPLGTGVKPAELEAVLARCRRVADEGVAIYHRDMIQEQANDYTGIDRLMLPMGDRDGRVDLILSIIVRTRNT